MPAAAIRLLTTLALMVSATSLAPLASATADSSDGAARGPSARAGRAAGPSSARAAAPVTTRIYARPTSVTIYGTARFSYGSDTPGLSFRCRLRGPDREDFRFRLCPSDSPTSKGGRVEYTGLRASRGRYTFLVQAFEPATATNPEVSGSYAEYSYHIYTLYSPSHYSPRNGATFNRPLSRTRTNTNINKMINTINSMPGYKQGNSSTCPFAQSLRPSSIRISLYSLTGRRFAASLVAAHRRCVSVQVLMNNHLDRATDPAWKRLEDVLGTNVYGGGRAHRSFAHRCSFGCRGSGVLHTKMYLFDSHAMSARFNKINTMVVTGSSNMTFNATNIQYNDLYTVRGRADLYRTYLRMFNLMKRDNGVDRHLVQATDGSYQTTFWPQDPGGPDPQMTMLRSIRCTGATGGTGFRGHTVVHVNMHAWFNARGLRFARQVRKMYNQGCYVHVLYGFMSFGVFKILRNGTGSRMTVRRTLFSHNGHTGYVYTHFKNVLANGHVGNDTSARVVWTGSNNFTDSGTHFDEVMMRIPFASAYFDYRRQFRYISNRLSSAKYAIFQEPVGGGRAPRLPARALDVPAAEAWDLPPGTPTITSPDITFDENGEPRALD